MKLYHPIYIGIICVLAGIVVYKVAREHEVHASKPMPVSCEISGFATKTGDGLCDVNINAKYFPGMIIRVTTFHSKELGYRAATFDTPLQTFKGLACDDGFILSASEVNNEPGPYCDDTIDRF